MSGSGYLVGGLKSKVLVTFQPKKDEAAMQIAKGPPVDTFEVGSYCETFSNDSFKYEEIVKKLTNILNEMDRQRAVLARDKSRAVVFNRDSCIKIREVLADMTSPSPLALSALDSEGKSLPSYDQSPKVELEKTILIRESEISQMQKEIEELKARNARLEQDLKYEVQRSMEMIKNEYIFKSRLNRLSIEKKELETLVYQNLEEFVRRMKEEHANTICFITQGIQTESEVSTEKCEGREMEVRAIEAHSDESLSRQSTQTSVTSKRRSKNKIQPITQKFELDPYFEIAQIKTAQREEEKEIPTQNEKREPIEVPVVVEFTMKILLIALITSHKQASQLIITAGLAICLILRFFQNSLLKSRVMRNEDLVKYIFYFVGVYLSCRFFKRDVALTSLLFSLAAEHLGNFNTKLVDGSLPESQLRALNAFASAFFAAFLNSFVYFMQFYELFTKQSLSKLAVNTVLGGFIASITPFARRWGIDANFKNTLIFGIVLTWSYRYY